MLLLLRLRLCFKLSNEIVLKMRNNPYFGMESTTLVSLLKKQLENKPKCIGDINRLIRITNASSKCSTFKYETLLQQTINTCIESIDQTLEHINELSQNQVIDLDVQQILDLGNNQIGNSNVLSSKICIYYANTYSHLLTIDRHLDIYDQAKNNPNLQLIKQISFNIIHERINANVSLSAYVKYLRLFHHQLTVQQIVKRLQGFDGGCPHIGLNQSEKIVGTYILMLKGINAEIYKNIKLQPVLDIGVHSNAKQICLKLQIRRFRGLPSLDLSHITLDYWNIYNLTWLSEFSHSLEFKTRLHQQILSRKLPPHTKPSVIMTYVNNAQLKQKQHEQICKWLCCQINLLKQECDLCQILLQINEKGWFSYYKQFYLFVLQQSLGNFNWENQNIIYYLGIIHSLDHQNIQYLRRYIINSYAALGTARREVPTSSYFYKILAVTHVQKFYGDL